MHSVRNSLRPQPIYVVDDDGQKYILTCGRINIIYVCQLITLLLILNIVSLFDFIICLLRLEQSV